MPDYTSTHQKVQLSPAMYHPIYQNRQLKDLKIIQFHKDDKVLQMNTKEACKFLETYSMAAVYGERNRHLITYCRYQQFELWISVMYSISDIDN